MQTKFLQTWFRRLLVTATLVVIGVTALFAFARFGHVEAAAGINETVNYQGRLLTATGAVVPDGSYNMEFKITKGGDGCNPTSGTFPCSGTVQWTETRESGNKVLVKNGYFSVYLGSVTAFGGSVDWNDDTLWLSTNIGGTGTPSYDGAMKPLTRLSATPYALNSKYLGGLTSSQFVQLAPAAAQSDGSANPSIFVNDTGGGNLLQLQVSASDKLVVATSGNITTAGDIAINGGDITSSGALTVTPNAGSNLNVNLSTTGDFVVNTNQLVVDTSAGFVGVGDTTPDANFDIDATLSHATTGVVSSIASGNTVSDTIVTTAGTNTTTGGRISVTRTGATGGTINTLGLDIQAVSDNAGAGTSTLTGLNVNVSGADTNYAALFAGGNVGISDSTPDAALEVLSTTEQLRLTFTDGSVDSRFTVDSSGNLNIDNTGTKTVIADDLQVTGNDILDSSATSRLTVGATNAFTGALTVSTNLDVAGTIFAGTADAFQVSSTGVVTYVNGTTGTDTVVCRNGSGQLAGCNSTFDGSVTLQDAYNNGNTITGTTGRNISITLADLATDQTLEVTQAGTADAFRVNDDGTFSDTTAFVVDQSGNLGIGDSTPDFKLDVEDTSTATSGGNTLSNFALTVSPASAPGASTSYTGFNGSVTSGSANVNANVSLTGGSGIATYSGTATLGFAGGLQGSVTNTAAGTITAAAAFKANLGTSAGTIADAYNFYANSPFMIGGAITNAYGLYIAGQKAGGATTGYGVYQAGATDINYFAGNLGIGDVSPAALLTVGASDAFQVANSGDITTAGDLNVNGGDINSTGQLSITSGTAQNIVITAGGIGQIRLNDGVEVGTLSAVQSDSYVVCRSTSLGIGRLSACDANTSGKPFIQGGNTFGAVALLGTNDGNGLSFETNTTVRASFANGNTLYLGNADPTTGLAASPNAFTVQGTGSSTAATTGGALTVVGGAGNTSGAGGLLTLQGGAGGSTGAGGGVTIASGTTGASGAAGGALTLQAGTATVGSGAGFAGGNVGITAGAGSNAAGTSNNGGAAGAISLQAGAGGAGSSTLGDGATGGAISLTAGAGGAQGGLSANGGAGGAINITGGASQYLATGGAVTITSGASGTGNPGATITAGAPTFVAGGSITLQASNSTLTNNSFANVGGNVSIAAGNTTTISSAGNQAGGITLTAGNATGASGTNRIGGSITLNAGTGATSNGGINIGTAAAAQTITIGNVTGATGVAINTGPTGGLTVTGSASVGNTNTNQYNTSITATGGLISNANRFLTTLDSVSAASQSIFSLNGIFSLPVTNSSNYTGNGIGVLGSVDWRGAGNSSGSRLDGVRGLIQTFASSGTTENIAAFSAGMTLNGGATTTAQGFLFNNPGGSSAITELYGVRIGALSRATSNAGIAIDEASGTNQTNLLIGTTTIPTGSYSIYNSSTDQNYFAGNVGIGDASPAALLTVGNGDLFQVTSTGSVSSALSNAQTWTLTPTLAAGARSSDVLTISQANDGTNDSTGNLLELNNADTGSTAAVLNVVQAATGNGIAVSVPAGGTGVSVTGATSGFGFSSSTTGGIALATSATTTGSGVTGGANLTSGALALLNLGSNTALSSGSVARVTGAQTGALTAYTGNLIDVTPTRTLTSGSINDTGSYLNLARANTVNNAGSTFTVSGDVATLSSNCTQTAGTCTDSGRILSLTQLNTAATGVVLAVTQNSTGSVNAATINTSSTTAALSIVSPASGVGLAITGITNGTGVQVSVQGGTGYGAASVTSGVAFTTGASVTAGTGYNFGASTVNLTSGKAFNVTGTASGALNAFTGAFLNITPLRTLTSGSIDDTANFINVARANTVNNAGSVYTVSGDVANLSSNCTQTAGTCTDTGNVLELNQQYATATGSVLNVLGAGTGNLATLDASNSSANGVSIDVQSSSSSQFALKVTSNNGSTNGLYVRADGNVGIGDTTPLGLLTVGSGDLFQVASTGATSITSAASATLTATNSNASGNAASLNATSSGSTLLVDNAGSGRAATFTANSIASAVVLGNSGVGNSLAVLSGASNVFQITNAVSAIGSALFKNVNNNANAFVIQNSGSTPVFTVNTATAGATIAGTLDVSGASTFNGTIAANTDTDFTFAGTENLAVTSDLAGNVNVLSIIGTPSSTAGLTRGIVIQQADSANTNQLDSAFLIDNADTNLAITNAIAITNSGGGGYTNLLDSPSLDITGTGAIIGATGITSSGTITFSGLNCTGNTNGGALTANGSGVISCSDDDSGGGGATLQSAYTADVDGSDAVIALTSTDGGVIIRDNATPLGSTLFAVQNSAGSSSYLSVNTAGITTAGDIAVNGGDITSSGALTVTPNAGSNLNIALSTTGDFVVNTNQLVVDTSTGFVAIGDATPDFVLDVDGTTTATSGTNNALAVATYTVSPGSAPGATTSYVGLQGTVTSASANLNANTSLIGVNALAQNTGTGSPLYLIGSQNSAINSGGGSPTAAIASIAGVTNSGAGTIGLAYGYFVNSPSVTSGAITSAYGLAISPQKVSGVGTGYGVFQSGTTDINYFGGRVGIGSTAPQTKLEVVGNITSEGTEWTSRTSAADNQWQAVTYGNGMFVAVAQSGSGNRVMTSTDGVNWIARTSAADNAWKGIIYGNGLFVTVSASGTGNRVMTSPDGINWTSRVSAADNPWKSVAYANGLFVAVASTSGVGNRVMTSPDGINWTIRASSADSDWNSVTYGNGKFVAVAYGGTSRVMTSPDGITWTNQTAAAAEQWRAVTYGNGIFVATADSGTADRVMTSTDGITWSLQTYPTDNSWGGLTYGNGLFVATANTGTGNRVMTSPDGINWVNRTSAVDNDFYAVNYGNGIFVAVSENGTGNRVMTSGIQKNTVVSANNQYNGGMDVYGDFGVNFGSSALVNIDTGTLSQLVRNSSFESNINGWTKKGAAAAAVLDSSAGAANFGNTALKEVTTAATTDGAQYSVPLLPSTQYSFSLYAKADSAINVILGRQENGSDVETSCVAVGLTTSYQRLTCTFTTGSTINASTNIYFRQTTAAVHTIWIDGVSLVAGGTGLTFDAGGNNFNIQSLNSNVTINGTNTGELQPWQLNSNSMAANRDQAGAVSQNGFAYVVGGWDGTAAANTVYYSRMNADGSLGAFTSSGNTLPAGVRYPAVTVANGYLYVVGGASTAGVSATTIYYSKLNSDGSNGTWQTNAVPLPAARYGASVASSNGILYVLGGCTGTDATLNCTTPSNVNYYGKLTADGSIIGVTASGTLTSTANNLPAARGMGSAVFANGFMYYAGGYNASIQNTVYWSAVTAGGDLGSWTTSGSTAPNLATAKREHTTAIANGYMYILDGCTAVTSGVCTTASNTTQYAKLNGDGTYGTWQTSGNNLPVNRSAHSTLLANGYIYVFGGFDGTSRFSNVYYSSTARVLLGGALDLVGLSSQSLGDYGGGGALTAGNTRIVGDLKVDGYADFNNGISVDSAVNINGVSASAGQAIFNINNLNSNSIFSIRHMSTNFGSLATAGAFIQKNSYFGEEFNIGKLSACAPAGAVSTGVNAFARGDAGGQGTAAACTAAGATVNGGELNASLATNGTVTFGTCAFASPGVTTVNGVEQITATSVATTSATASCAENLAGTTTTSNRIYLPANLPVVTMKVKATAVASNNNSRVQVGLVPADSANGLGVNSPANSIYFTNCSTWNNAAAPSGCSNTTWYGVTSGASAATVVTCSTGSGAIGTNFAYMRIEVRAAADVHFYVDYNTTDGINETECGTGSTTNVTSSALTAWLESMFVTNTANSTVLQIDYFRSWQDDNFSLPEESSETLPSGDPAQSEPPLTESTPGGSDAAATPGFVDLMAATSEDTTFDHDVYVKGTLFADKIRANQIEGLDVYTDQLASLQAHLAQTSGLNDQNSTAPPSTTTEPGSTTPTPATSLTIQSVKVTLDLDVQGGLSVGGEANFHGNVFFYKLVTFVEKTVFRNDISFEGRATFNNDTAGFATIYQTQHEVHITFGKPYDEVPVVTISVSNGKFVQYAYKDLTKEGFTIILPADASEEINFSWTALSIKDAKTAKVELPPQSP